jgi:hypothetical protein
LTQQNLIQQRQNRRRRSSQQPQPLPALILWLLQRHISLIWLATLAILIGSGTAAITTILDPDASVSSGGLPSVSSVSGVSTIASPAASAEATPLENFSTSTPTGLTPSPDVAKNPQRVSDAGRSPQLPQQRQVRSSQPASPQSAVGAIAVSCAAGCFLISQWMKPKTVSRRRVLFEPQPSTLGQPQPSAASEGAEMFSEASPTVSIAPAPRLPQSCTSSISFDIHAAPPQAEGIPVTGTAATATSSSPVEVTVLPSEQSHPLDWNEPSLADHLDLRHRRPLSYWL